MGIKQAEPKTHKCIKNYYKFSDQIMIDKGTLVEIRQGAGVILLDYAGKRTYLSNEEMEEFFREI